MSSVALTCAAALLSAQPTITPLKAGATVSGRLAAGDTARFALALRDSAFVLGSVTQPDEPLVVRLLAGGQARGRFEGPGTGALRFSAFTGDTGAMLVEVTAPSRRAAGFALTLLRQEPPARDPARRADQLLARYDAPGVPGGEVRVWRNGRVLYSKGFGMADLRHGIPYRTTTPTNLGSTSKQFTAFAVLLQAERGKLSLEDDIRKHIPELPYLGDTVRVRHLLTHQSGLREFLNLLAMSDRQIFDDVIDRTEIIRVVQRQPRLQNTPGAEWNYNNTAFGLAALIVERTSGKSYPAFLRDEVFVPLGMTRSTARADRATIIPNAAMGYLARPTGYAEANDLSGALGAGGIYSTVEDLQRWAENMVSPAPRVGSRAIFETMMTNNRLTDGKLTGYGMGLSVGEQRGVRRIQHGGADVAHRSMLSVYPTLNAGVSVQSNFAGFNSAVANDIAYAFFADAMTGAPAPTPPAPTPARPAATLGAAALAAFAGQYWSEELESAMTIVQRGDTLLLRQRRHEDAVLVPQAAADTFEGRTLTLSFERDRNGAVIGFYAANGRTRDVRFARMR
ncbi:MAG: beta-lactamase family protein [Gemmatimonadetes bacterium]|nr:beta-lactamase family protein [Gemmatimonadota bacterium]